MKTRQIVERTIDSVDTKLLSIGGYSISIPIENNNWTSITLGMLGGIYSDSHQNILGVEDLFKMGLFDSTESISTDIAEINHFVGIEPEGAFTYNGTYNFYEEGPSSEEMKIRVVGSGASLYYQNIGLGHYFGAIPDKKLAIFLQIQKGPSFYSFRFFRSNSTSTPSTDYNDFLINMQSDFPVSIFGGMYDTPLNDSYGYSYGDSRSFAVDEATYGSLDVFGILWAKSTPTLEIEKMAYSIIE